MFKFKGSFPSVNGSQNVKGLLPSVYGSQVDGKKWKDLEDEDILLIKDYNKLKEAITTFCKNGKKRPRCTINDQKTRSLIIAVRKACGDSTYSPWREPLDMIQRKTLVNIIDPDRTIRVSTSYDVKRQMINFLQGKDDHMKKEEDNLIEEAKNSVIKDEMARLDNRLWELDIKSRLLRLKNE
ncbi:hypothetical protein CL647_05730 [bacterium]|nr:hypothetical protein [bacterium]|tara:strand:+ start:3586 stop:4131 length:546 start_codon:yes stop_codon:yes gene_type:complete